MRTSFLLLGLLLSACGGNPVDGDSRTDDDGGTGRDAATDAGSRAGHVDGSAPAGHADAGTDGGTAPALDVPKSLVDTLSVKPYVEESCTAITFAGWPYPALACTYSGNLHVTVADPTPERVARWIVDASTLIPALNDLHKRDRAHWEAGLGVMATRTLNQSSRIFPLDGTIAEDGTNYNFHYGVTTTCSTGCYCRVNSTSRQQWCHYAAKVMGQNEASCNATNGLTSGTLTQAWLDHCFANHKAAWTVDRNEDYRAEAYVANEAMAAQFTDPAKADGAAVVTALKAQYP